MNASESEMRRFSRAFRGRGDMTLEYWKHINEWFSPLKSGRHAAENDGYDILMILDVCDRPWFRGFMLAEEAFRLLKHEYNGTFILRFSGTVKGAYTISFKNNGVVSHSRIHPCKEPFKNPRYRIRNQGEDPSDELYFDSLDDFVFFAKKRGIKFGERRIFVENHYSCNHPGYSDFINSLPKPGASIESYTGYVDF
eukprot:TRINITY_DN2485_c0_g1_i2.p1 TRINITY_DN2485_c0_g1~~TRINITY_DN2485_c0_g1_i2.p1  ORF type:complete len:196 (-),score=34.24 TRINITY_DN2485_c0_g1_i2:82-669(-)